jgi:hypothetical protein
MIIDAHLLTKDKIKRKRTNVKKKALKIGGGFKVLIRSSI